MSSSGRASSSGSFTPSASEGPCAVAIGRRATVIAVLGGLGAAVFFSIGTLASSRSSRMLGSNAVLGWVMLIGLAVVAPLVALIGIPANLSQQTIIWLLFSGAGNVSGLMLEYAALRIGKVGLVAPIASTEGAIAAVIAVIAGEPLSAVEALTLAVIAIGVVLAALVPEDLEAVESPSSRRAILLSGGAAIGFGVSLYATGRIGADLPIPWVLLPARLIGVAAIAIPLMARRRLRLTRPVVPLVLAGGLCELIGFTSYTIGARDAIAVSAILVSQFATISTIVAWLLFHERLARLQVLGVAVVIVGVAALTLLQA